MERLSFGTVPSTAVWNRCKVIRKFAHLTQAKLIEEAEISIGTLVRIEEGDDFKVSLELRKRVLDVLNRHLKKVFKFIEFNDLYPTHRKGDKPHPRYDDPIKVEIQAFIK